VDIAVLAIQGAFAEHETMLQKLGATCIELRGSADMDKPFDALVLPGGESTVQGKLLHELGMLDDIRQRIVNGMPVLATCAGLILLADRIANDSRTYLRTLPVTVRRNAYGRQLGSFRARGLVQTINQMDDESVNIDPKVEGKDTRDSSHEEGLFPMEFIRAPYIEQVDDDVEVLAEVDGHIVAVRYHSQLAMAFHPELTDDTRIHRLFLDMVTK
jgi:5'-phosphate synthase pdxT subunit